MLTNHVIAFHIILPDIIKIDFKTINIVNDACSNLSKQTIEDRER